MSDARIRYARPLLRAKCHMLIDDPEQTGVDHIRHVSKGILNSALTSEIMDASGLTIGSDNIPRRKSCALLPRDRSVAGGDRMRYVGTAGRLMWVKPRAVSMVNTSQG